jgi:hypothetical protein
MMHGTQNIKKSVGDLRNANTICPRGVEGGDHLGDLNVNGKTIRSAFKKWDLGIRSCDLSVFSFWDINALYVVILLPTVQDNIPPLTSKVKQSKKNDWSLRIGPTVSHEKLVNDY